MLFTSLLDLQLLIGLVLYFTSPFMQPILQNFGQAMGNSSQRFFAVEHVFAMIAAIVVAHIGRSLSKKAAGDAARHKRAAIGFTVALVLILAAIPWSRPLLQFFGVAATCRASLAFYNTHEEIEAFMAALKKVRSLLG